MNFRLALLSGVAALVAATSAQAQTTAPQDGPSVTSLDEIVVTARRREENLQDVPVSVTAFTAEDLDRKRITDRTALADATPSLITITGGYPKEFAFFALRGQGPAFGAVPGTITYFAEVPNAINVDGRTGSFYDLANVQVLAGPQGTLFGRNATGGNILFEPQRPTNTFGGYVRGEIGNFADRRFEGAINLPIVEDKALLRIAGEVGRRDGYTIDVGPVHPGRDYDNLAYESFRVSLTLNPFEGLETYTVGRYYHSDNNGPGTVLTAVNPAASTIVSPFLPPFVVGTFFPTLTADLAAQQARGPRRVAYEYDEFSKSRAFQILNQTTLRLTDNLKLKNIVSYSEFRQWYGYDYDASLNPIAGQGVRGDVPIQAVDTFTEELQLQGELFDKAVTFAAGGYYDKLSDPQAGQFLQFPFSVLLGGSLRAELETKLDSHAVFGQATADLGKLGWIQGLSVTAGYRYTWEHYSNSAIIIAPPAVTGEGDFQYGSYNLSLDYDLTEGVHAYVTVRDAYKSGGVNGGVAAGSPFYKFAPEKLEDVELGLKSQFHIGDMAARANIAAYRGVYTNIQRTTTELISGVNLNVTRSAAEGRIQGVEFTGALVPIQGLTLSGSLSYTDAKYTKISDPSALAILAGSPFPFTPKTKFSLGVTYERPLGDNIGTLVLGANYADQSSFSTGQTNASFIRYLDGYNTLNLSADLNNVAGRPVDLSVFVSNVADKEYATGVADFYNQSFGVATLTYGEPRMYGVRLRYRFGG